MAYENGRMLFTTGLAGIAAFSALQPHGWPIFVMAGTAAGNPGDMYKAGQEWREVAGDFEGVVKELTTLVDKMPEDDWTAEDREAFQTSVNAFKTELTKSGQIHNGVGDNMESLAKLYYAFAVLIFSVGGILLALIGVVAAALATGIGAGPAVATSKAIAAGLQKIVELALKKKMISLGVAGLLLTAVIAWNQSKQSQLEGKATNPYGQGAPEFTQAKLDLTIGDTPSVGTGTSPYGTGTSPYGTGTSPYGTGTSPYGTGTSPYGTGTSPYGTGTSPYGTGTSPSNGETEAGSPPQNSGTV